MRPIPRDLLRAATIEVVAQDGPQPGTGFFVAPGLACTSASLVGELQRQADGHQLVPTAKPVQLFWRADGKRALRYTASVAAFLPDVDVALLHVDLDDHPCVYLDAAERHYGARQSFSCFGYPPGSESGELCLPEFIGLSHDKWRMRLDVPAPTDLSRFTGAALLNEQSGGVAGLVVGARAVDRAYLVRLTELRQYLVKFFSLEELDSLCAELGFRLDNLPNANQGLDQVALALIRRMDQEGPAAIQRLVELAEQSRSSLPPFQPSDAATIPADAPELSTAYTHVSAAFSERQAGGVDLAWLLDRPELTDLIGAQQRYHTARPGWVRALTADQRRMAGRCYPADVGPPEQCPYPGLRPFTDANAAHFHGREQEVTELLQRISDPTTRLLVITGASGSGKSSLARAGLLPEIRRLGQTMLAGDRALRLNDRPYTDLCAALGIAADLAVPPADAIRAVLAQAGRQRLLVLIDQFEELLYEPAEPSKLAAPTQQRSATGDERRRALELLRDLRRSPDLPVALMLVVRGEAVSLLSQWELAPSEALTHRMRRLSDNGLRQAIVAPAESLGVLVEPPLVERLVAQANPAANPLPLIQVALTILWDTMRGHQLTLANYEQRVGTLAEAIKRQADNILDQFTAADQRLARNMIIRLVDLREKDDDVRRPQRQDQLLTVGDRPAQARLILDRLVETNLLVSDSLRGIDWIELCHEALIADWPTLRDTWLGRSGAGDQPSLRDCELERRSWEYAVEAWRRSDHKRLETDEQAICRGLAWDAGCGQELGPVPGLAEYLGASEQERVKQQRRRWTLLFVLVAVFIIALFVVYIFFAPILPRW